jgi:hypothetical protein
MSRRSHLIVLAGAYLALGSQPLYAQTTRAQRLAAADSAYAAFEVQRARDLLVAALDPSQGPLDSAWARGVQLLAQILLEQNDSLQAGSWLRWAFRLSPAWTVDSVTFLPEVVAAAVEARSIATRGSPGDSLTETRWIWPSSPAAATGAIQVAPSPTGAPVQVLVERAGIARAGETVQVAPGTYEIQAAADGHLATRVTREVLPGVTTVLEFDLLPVRQVAAADTAQAAPAPAPAPATPPATPPAQAVPRGGMSPMPFILGGGAAAAGLAALLLMGGDDNPGGGGNTQQGDIELSIPVNP